MLRLLWGAVALLAVILAVVLVPAGPGGQVPEEALAHIITPTGTPGAPMVHLEIDADATNGDGPCNPVDTTAAAQGTHKVAVCLTSSDQPPWAFDIDLLYDDTLNTCVDVPCDIAHGSECFDNNPDANLGATTFTTPDLGTGWDCSSDAANPPVCDNDEETGPGHGRASILCASVGQPTLPVGADVSSPIAVVTFDVLADGADTLSLENTVAYDWYGDLILRCYDPGDPCFGATLFVRAPVGGIAEAPLTETDVPAGELASSVPSALALAALVAGGTLLLMTGAWFARRRRRVG